MCQKKANIVLCHQFWHLDKKNPLEINFRYLILSHKVKLLRERPWVFQLVCLESSEMQILGNRLYQHSAEHETAGDTVSFVNQSDLPCAVSPTHIAIQDLTAGWFTPGLIYIFEGHSRSINDIIIYCVLSSLYMLFRFNARNMFIDHDSLHEHFSVLTSFTTIKQMVSNVFIQLSTPVIIKFSMIHLEFEIYKQPINLLLYILYIYMLYS